MLKINNKKSVYLLPLWGMLLIVPLLVSTQLLDQGLLSRFLGLQIFMLIIVVVNFKISNNQKYISYSYLTLAYLFFTVYTICRLLFGNINGDSIFDVVKIISFFLLFIIIVSQYSNTELKSSFLRATSLLGIIISLWGMIELILVLQNGKLSIPLDTYQIKLIYGHRNLYSQLLFFVLPFLLYLSTISNNKLKKTVFQITTTIIIFLLIILSNRASWFALVLAFTIILSILIFKKSLINNKFRPLIYILGISLFSSLLFFNFFTNTNEVKSHFVSISNPNDGSGKDRIELWKRSLKIIEDRPVFGEGPASWKIEMLKYGNKGLVSEDNVTFYQRPHNDFLWIASEFGLLGLVLYSLIFILAFVSLFKQMINETEEKNLVFKLAIFFSLVGFIVYSFLSFPHERIIHNLILAVLFALIVKGDKNLFYLKYLKLYNMVFLVLIISALYFGAIRYISEYHARKAIFAKNRGDYSTVINEVKKVNTSIYPTDPLSTPLYWYEGLAFYTKGDYVNAQKLFEKAYAINPYHVHILNNLASSYLKNNNVDAGIDLYKKTLEIYPDFEETKFNLCAAYFNKNTIDSALFYLNEIDPQTENPKYKTFIKAIVYNIIKDELVKLGRDEEIQFLPKDEIWYFNLFLNTKKENVSIKNYIFDNSELKHFTQNKKQ